QGKGSALTYARRYALSAALGIASEKDDDAAGAGQQRTAARKAPAAGSTEKKKPERPARPVAVESDADDAPGTKALWGEAIAVAGTRQKVIEWFRDARGISGSVGIKDVTNADLKELVRLAEKLKATEATGTD